MATAIWIRQLPIPAVCWIPVKGHPASIVICHLNKNIIYQMLNPISGVISNYSTARRNPSSFEG